MNEPMPRKLPVPTQFKVTDAHGRILRSEELPAGTALPDRLRLAHRNYQLQGWAVEPLRPGRWSFLAEKAGQRLLIGIRHCVTQHCVQHPSSPVATSNTVDRPPERRPNPQSAAPD
jgi:hypothetical protein